MRTMFRFLIVFATAFAAVPLFAGPPAAQAQQAPSPGCEALMTLYDGQYTVGSQATIDFYPGETITLTADEPVSGSTPTSVTLVIGGAVVDTTTFPGTVSYTFGSFTNTGVQWFVQPNTAQATWSTGCQTPPTGENPDDSGDDPAPEGDAAQEPVPGCDVRIAIPPTAVGALFVTDAPVYWAPGHMTDIVIPAGNTARAAGVDSAGEYYKVLWGCQYVWVPVNTLAPNPDAVWNSAPLPTTVVD